MIALSQGARMGSLLAAVGVLIFLLNIDYTAVNLTLVPIARETQSDLNTLQWLLSAYVLTWGALAIPGGRFADTKGKLPALTLGLLLFMMGSLLTGLGHAPWVLIGGRILQGIGAAFFIAPAYGLVFSSAPPEKQGMAMGVIGGFAGLGLAIGPTLAGWIIDTLGWRWIFYLNLPLGLFVLSALHWLTEKEHLQNPTASLSYGSISLLILGMSLFFFTLNQIEVWGLKSGLFWSLLAIGTFLLLFFWGYDQKQKYPTLPRSFFKNPPFVGVLVAMFVGSYAFSISLVLVTLYLQTILKLPSTQTGYVFLAMTLALGILSPLGGKLADKGDIRLPINGGFGLLLASFGVMMFWDSQAPLFLVMSALLMAGIGLGLNFPALNTALLKAISPQEINSGSALFTMIGMIGHTLSVIVNTSLLVLVGRPFLLKEIEIKGVNFSSEQKQKLVELIGKVEHSQFQLEVFPPELQATAQEVLNNAFMRGFKTCLGIAGLLLLLGIFIIQKRLKDFSDKKSPAL